MKRNETPLTSREESQIVEALRSGKGWRYTAQRFHRGGKTICAIAKKHGIASKRKIWTAEEEQYLREHYPNGRTRELALSLGRPLTQVYQKGRCAMCGCVIHFRPYNQTATFKICFHCAMKLKGEA